MAKTSALRPHDQYSRWGGRSRSDGDWRSNRDSLSTSQPSKKLDQYSRWGGRTRSDGDWRSNRDSLSTSQPSKKLDQYSRWGGRTKSDGDWRSNRDSLSTSQQSKGQVVKIFKRGEELKAKLLFGGKNKDLELKLCYTARLAQDTDDHDVKKENKDLELKLCSTARLAPDTDDHDVKKENKDLELKLCYTVRLAQDTDDHDVKKEIEVPEAEFYAGSAWMVSPPPSSLPYPSFLLRRNLIDSNLKKLPEIGSPNSLVSESSGENNGERSEKVV